MMTGCCLHAGPAGPLGAAEVLRCAPCCTQDVAAECIVMARHSKGRLKEMWVGSVTKVSGPCTC